MQQPQWTSLKKTEFYMSFQCSFSDIDLIILLRSLSNGAYQLRNYDLLEEYHVYCHMTELPGCGSGGWTLVMKIDGTKVK